MSFEKIIENLHQEFIKNENPYNAEKMSAYMQNKFSMFGIKSPQRKEIFKPFLKELKSSYLENYKEISLLMWHKDEREFQYCAIEFLQKSYKYWDENTIDLLRELNVQKSWWDTVDFIASHLVGHYMKTFSDDEYALMRDWNQDDDMWIVRTSILFQLRYKEHTNWDLLVENILRHEDSKEFFIRKAQGWALRQYSRIAPNEVLQFVRANPQLSGLTRREALKIIHKNQ